jgi:hypothetical protein
MSGALAEFKDRHLPKYVIDIPLCTPNGIVFENPETENRTMRIYE